jgi:hypothetical protein
VKKRERGGERERESNSNSFVKQVTDLFLELGSLASHLQLIDKDLVG